MSAFDVALACICLVDSYFMRGWYLLLSSLQHDTGLDFCVAQRQNDLAPVVDWMQMCGNKEGVEMNFRSIIERAETQSAVFVCKTVLKFFKVNLNICRYVIRNG